MKYRKFSLQAIYETMNHLNLLFLPLPCLFTFLFICNIYFDVFVYLFICSFVCWFWRSELWLMSLRPVADFLSSKNKFVSNLSLHQKTNANNVRKNKETQKILDKKSMLTEREREKDKLWKIFPEANSKNEAKKFQRKKIKMISINEQKKANLRR